MPIFLDKAEYDAGKRQIHVNMKLFALVLEREAKSILSGGKSRPGQPPGVDTGRLRNSVFARYDEASNTISFGVKLGAAYGYLLDKGTGLYGPNHALIRPKKATVLSWVRRDGRRVYVKFTKGAKARPWIQKSIREAAKVFKVKS